MENIKVRAKARGFYLDSQVEAGQEFELRDIVVKRLKEGTTKVYEEVKVSADQQFSDEWMEKVEAVSQANVVPFVPDVPVPSTDEPV